VMDPFCEAIKSCQNEFEKIIKNGKYDLNTEMLIAVWKNIINKFMEPLFSLLSRGSYSRSSLAIS
jgi:hypothetical protein